MIRAEGLRKIFRPREGRLLWIRRGEPKVAVEALDLRVQPGRITGLLGLNGAGKTTTIKMLATLLEPDGGHATVDGLDLVRDAARVRPLVNMIAGGERSLYLRLSARENLWYFGQLYGLGGRELEARIVELLRLVDLQGFLLFTRDTSAYVSLSQPPLSFLSGVRFPVAYLPGWLQPVSALLPLTWSLRTARPLLIEAATLRSLAGELAVVAGVSAACLVAAALISRRAEAVAKREGTLMLY